MMLHVLLANTYSVDKGIEVLSIPGGLIGIFTTEEELKKGLHELFVKLDVPVEKEKEILKGTLSLDCSGKQRTL